LESGKDDGVAIPSGRPFGISRNVGD